MNKRVESVMVKEKMTIKEVMKKMDSSGLGVALIADGKRRLKGLCTDGDIRRAIIKKDNLYTEISEIMKKDPVVATKDMSDNKILRLFNDGIKHIPVVDEKRKIIDLIVYGDSKTLKHGEYQVVRAKAPLRLSFAGGGTDVDEYMQSRGGIVLSTTINRYCMGTLIKRTDNIINIHSEDYNISVTIKKPSDLRYDGNLDLIKAVIKLMKPNCGMNLYFESDVPPGTGLGASATVASVAVGLMNHLKEDKLDSYQIAETAYQAERIELGISGGWQDQYAAVFGGFNFIEFNQDDIIVHPLKIRDDVLNELEYHLILCYTGKTRVSGDIVKRQTKAYLENNSKVKGALDRTRGMAIEMKNKLLKGRLDEFGKLLHDAWELKKNFDPSVTNKK